MASRMVEREVPDILAIPNGDIFCWLKRAEYIDPLSGPAICSKIIVLSDEEWSDNPGKCPDNEQRDAIEKHIEEVTALGLPYRIPDPTNNKYGLFRVSSDARSKFSDYGDIGRQAELLVDGVKARIAKVIGLKSLTRYCPYIVSPENASSFDLLLPPATVASVLDLPSARRELPFFEVSEEGKRDVVVFADCIRREFGIPLNVCWTSVGQEAREFLWYTVEKGKAAKQRMIDGKALRGDELSYLLFEASALVIVEENMGLVYKEIVRKYRDYAKYKSVLLVYGMEALFATVEQYDFRLGFEFSTLAFQNIRYALEKFPDEHSWHGISRSSRNLNEQITAAEYQLRSKKVDPTPEAISTATNGDISPCRVRANRSIKRLMLGADALETKFHRGISDEIVDAIGWDELYLPEGFDNRPTEEEAFAHLLFEGRMFKTSLMDTLTPRQKEILRLLSLEDGPETNIDLGKSLGLSRETARQEITKIRKKLNPKK